MKIVTSLSLPGTCREAFDFYAEALGGKIIAAIAYGEAPPGVEMDPAIKDWLMHCWLQVGDQALMGSDMHPAYTTDMHKPKDGFDVTLHFDDAREALRIFDRLSQGGEIRMPFAETSWSPGFGGFTDRFGVPWMINTIPAADWAPKGA
ncbi:VOC family protein [Brevundimonas sp.]|uniref:VOC family protein n=1 Tax=Brevundimonas sp. TaxID=1871086 RepID=UPI003BA9A3DD